MDKEVAIRVCFADKQKVFHEIADWGHENGWMKLLRKDGTEVLINPDKVNWVEIEK